MTIDYKILWIDDHEDFFRNHEEFIKEHIEEKGFEAHIIKHKSLNEYLEHDDNKEDQIKYDLFLVDLNLDNGHTGNEIIEKIRSNKVLTDIIFYSTNLADVRRSVSDNNIEGVFVTSRNQDDFEEKVTDIIDVTIKKVQDVNNLRGLIMAEVAELDRLKKNIIKKHCELTENKDNELKKYVKDKVFNDFNSKMTEYEFLTSEASDAHEHMQLATFIDDLMYDSFKKARTMSKINQKRSTGISFNLDEYISDVIKKRNVFAHEKEKMRESDKVKVLSYPDGSELEFTEKHCVQIRKDIRKYKDILEQINSQLTI